MRRLIPPDGPDSNVDVHAFYGVDWLESGGLRLNFVASADGAIAVAGRSRGLQTPGDNRVYAAMRDLADVVLVGAGTARTEGYGPARPRGERLRRRIEAGLGEQLPIAVVTASLGLDPSTKLFADAQARTIVFTCARAETNAHPALRDVADLVICGDEEVDLAGVRAELLRRGLSRIVCEGGPTLSADLAQAGLVDELCLSLSPLIAGPGSGRITAGPQWSREPLPLELVGLLVEDDAMFCRYRVRPLATGLDGQFESRPSSTPSVL